jgi:hypothetical protein
MQDQLYSTAMKRTVLPHRVRSLLLAVLAALLLPIGWAAPAFAQTPCDATGEPLGSLRVAATGRSPPGRMTGSE